MKGYKDTITEATVFIAIVATFLLVIFLSACAVDDPERMAVQAEGTQANHDRAHCRARTLDRAQPASAPKPC